MSGITSILSITFDREFDSILRTKKQKEKVELPELSVGGGVEEEELVDQEDSDNPQVTFLVSCITMNFHKEQDITHTMFRMGCFRSSL